MILTNETFLAHLSWRYATRKFDPARKIPPATWTTLEKALGPPSPASGTLPWRFVIVRDPQLRVTLQPLTKDQPQLTDCSHFVVFARKNALTGADVEKLLRRTTEERGRLRGGLLGYNDLMAGAIVNGPRHVWIREWTARQAYFALGNLMISAALLGVDACPMERLDPAGYDEALGLAPKGYSTVCACALGYRAADDPFAATEQGRHEFYAIGQRH